MGAHTHTNTHKHTHTCGWEFLCLRTAVYCLKKHNVYINLNLKLKLIPISHQITEILESEI